MFMQMLFDRRTCTDKEHNNLGGGGWKEKNMRVSIVAALVSHSRLLSCKYHTQRLLLAKFLCLVIHIWADRSRTRAPPLLMTPASNRKTHTSSPFYYCHSDLHVFTAKTTAYLFTSSHLRVLMKPRYDLYSVLAFDASLVSKRLIPSLCS